MQIGDIVTVRSVKYVIGAILTPESIEKTAPNTANEWRKSGLVARGLCHRVRGTKDYWIDFWASGNVNVWTI